MNTSPNNTLIVGLLSLSPHAHGMCERMLESLLQHIQCSFPGMQTTTLHLSTLAVAPYTDGVEPDDFEARLMPFLDTANIVIGITPVYWASVPAQAKALIDRFQSLWQNNYVKSRHNTEEFIRKPFILNIFGTGLDPFGVHGVIEPLHGAFRMAQFELMAVGNFRPAHQPHMQHSIPSYHNLCHAYLTFNTRIITKILAHNHVRQPAHVWKLSYEEYNAFDDEMGAHA